MIRPLTTYVYSLQQSDSTLNLPIRESWSAEKGEDVIVLDESLNSKREIIQRFPFVLKFFESVVPVRCGPELGMLSIKCRADAHQTNAGENILLESLEYSKHQPIWAKRADASLRCQFSEPKWCIGASLVFATVWPAGLPKWIEKLKCLRTS